jgi:hypothetical protein
MQHPTRKHPAAITVATTKPVANERRTHHISIELCARD